jgi:hypothetical protein
MILEHTQTARADDLVVTSGSIPLKIERHVRISETLAGLDDRVTQFDCANELFARHLHASERAVS